MEQYLHVRAILTSALYLFRVRRLSEIFSTSYGRRLNTYIVERKLSVVLIKSKNQTLVVCKRKRKC